MNYSISNVVSNIQKESIIKQSTHNFYNNNQILNEFEKETSQLWLLRQLKKNLSKANLSEDIILDFIFKQVNFELYE